MPTACRSSGCPVGRTTKIARVFVLMAITPLALLGFLQDTIEALKREIVRNPKSDEYRKALKSTGERLTIAKQILAREEARA